MSLFSQQYQQEIKKTFLLALPIVIAQLGVVLMGVTDNIMVGRYIGKIGLGAAGIANSLSFLIASIGMGGLSVVAPLISKAKAEKNIPEINRLFRAGIKVALWFSLILGLVGLLCIYCFEIFQQSPEINTQAPAFMAIIVVSNAFIS